MKRYELLEHTADIKMKVYGKTLEELFCNAAYGMANVQKSKIKSRKLKIKRKISVEAVDLETLLVDFLSEILTLSDTYHEVYPKIFVSYLSKNKIKAEIFGFPVEQFDEDIKAVTYHGLEVKKINSNWQAVILFDI